VTEPEWLTSADPSVMLQHLWTRPGTRKLRLYGAACCRQVWERIIHAESRRAVEVAERFADGCVPAAELADARNLHRSCGAWRVQRNAAEAVSQATLDERRETSSLEAALGAAKYAAHAWTDKPEGGARSYREASWRPLWDSARNT